ncbi:response regulator, partial [Bacteroidota bacterium]
IEVIGSTLRIEGYKMEFATDGNQAFSWTKKKNFDLILLDIMMPEIDGFEVCKRLKADVATKNIPIIFLTAKTDTEAIAKGLEIGAVDYVTKPFDPVELIARVETHLKRNFAEQQLKLINATKDKLFSIIAHDLRNPFNVILGYSDILLDDINTMELTDVRKSIEDINNCTKKACELLQNLLDWSMTQLEGIKYTPINTSLNIIVEKTITLLYNIAQLKNIQVKNNVPSDATIFVDEDMLSTVFRNLISNALKFTNKGGEININANIKNGFIEVVIADNGVGIAKENLSKLFKIEDSYSTKGTANENGTGLGLVLCKEFINHNGGEITVESELGKGTKFIFTIPKGNQKA